MTFSYTLTNRYPLGSGYVKILGTFVNTGSTTGGAIITTLASVDTFLTDASATGTVNIISVSSGTVTLTTGAGVDGNWEAIGITQ